MLALIPARGGSKSLPGKNIRPFAGIPLIAHSILMAKMCPQVEEVVVSTDDEKIAEVARRFGARVPFLRPAELAQDDTPMWLVLRHALETLEKEGNTYDYLLLLDPTSPGRFPKDVEKALQRLQNYPKADGIIGVSQPEFNPVWHSVVEKEGFMEDLFDGGSAFSRRQDAPKVYRINASLYIWRSQFVKREKENWRKNGRHLIYEIEESRAIHIDDMQEFIKAEILVRNGFIQLPWLKENK